MALFYGAVEYTRGRPVSDKKEPAH
jgi:hypothetical protein